MIADRGYDADWYRDALKRRGIAPCIPPKKNRKTKYRYDKKLYKQRHKVENMFGRIGRSAWRYLLPSFSPPLLLALHRHRPVYPGQGTGHGFHQLQEIYEEIKNHPCASVGSALRGGFYFVVTLSVEEVFQKELSSKAFPMLWPPYKILSITTVSFVT